MVNIDKEIDYWADEILLVISGHKDSKKLARQIYVAGMQRAREIGENTLVHEILKEQIKNLDGPK